MKNDRRRRLARGAKLLASFIVALAACVTIAGAATTASPSRQSYIVVMAGDPAVAYDGGTAGFAATKPEHGKKFNANSTAAKRYRAHLVREHNGSLEAVVLSANRKLNDYRVA